MTLLFNFLVGSLAAFSDDHKILSFVQSGSAVGFLAPCSFSDDCVTRLYCKVKVTCIHLRMLLIGRTYHAHIVASSTAPRHFGAEAKIAKVVALLLCLTNLAHQKNDCISEQKKE